MPSLSFTPIGKRAEGVWYGGGLIEQLAGKPLGDKARVMLTIEVLSQGLVGVNPFAWMAPLAKLRPGGVSGLTCHQRGELKDVADEYLDELEQQGVGVDRQDGQNPRYYHALCDPELVLGWASSEGRRECKKCTRIGEGPL